MNNIVIGRYLPGNSFLYAMDPRTKIIALILLMAATFIISSHLVMLVGIVVILGILLAGKISVKRVYLGLRPLMFLLIFTFTFQVLFNRQGEELLNETLNFTPITILVALVFILTWFMTKKMVRFKLLYFLLTVFLVFYTFIALNYGNTLTTSRLIIHEEGLRMAFFIMMRLIIIVTLSTILTITTKPTDLNLGLESVLKPLRVVRVNTEEMAMIIAISLRYIPTLLDEANKIMLAQASRGVDFTEGKLKDKIVQIVSLLVPMFIISFKRSEELANAMEARSFVPGNKRTRLHQLIWKRIDTVTISISACVLVAMIVLRIVL